MGREGKRVPEARSHQLLPNTNLCARSRSWGWHPAASTPQGHAGALGSWGGGPSPSGLTFLAVSPGEAPLAGTLVALQPGAAAAPVLAGVGLLGAGVGSERGDLHGAADVGLLQHGHPLDGDLPKGEAQGQPSPPCPPRHVPAPPPAVPSLLCPPGPANPPCGRHPQHPDALPKLPGGALPSARLR